MMQVLSAHDDGAPNFDCRSLVAPIGCPDDVVTRPLLREAIEDLFRDKADVALLHFSGHGTVNNLDGYLATQDARKYDEGVAMNEVLRLANESPVSEIVIFLDCCYSGRLGNVPAIRNNDALLREGGLDPSRKSGGALHRLHCFCLEFDGACEVQRRVPTDWIIEPVDVSGYGSFSLAS